MLSENTNFPLGSVMRRGFLNTDCTDYTDAFYGDVDIPLCSVVRKGSEHGLHGLHGCFLWGRGYSLEFRGAWRVLNWDCADSDEEREGNGLGRHGLFPLLLLNGLMSFLGSGGSIICFV